MGRWSSFLLGGGVGSIAVYMCMHFCVVHSAGGFQLVRKTAPNAEIPYVDVRNFTYQDWQERPALATAVLRANRARRDAPSSLAPLRALVDRALATPATPAALANPRPSLNR